MRSQGKVSAEEAADELEETCRGIAGLIVYGVGVGNDELFVYCRGSLKKYAMVPHEFRGFKVTVIGGGVAFGDGKKRRQRERKPL